MKRSTKQREAIRSVFAEAGRPLTVVEAHELVLVKVPSLGIATVYRAVKDLLDQEWLTSIEVGGATRYELANLGHHHHFHCDACDRTFDIPGCVGDLQKLVPDSFRLVSHQLTLVGECETCLTGTA